MLLYLTIERYLFTFGAKTSKFDTLSRFLMFATMLVWVAFVALFWLVFSFINYPLFAGTRGFCSWNRVYTFSYSLYTLLVCQLASCLLAVIVHQKNKSLLSKFNVDSQQHDLTSRYSSTLFFLSLCNSNLPRKMLINTISDRFETWMSLKTTKWLVPQVMFHSMSNFITLFLVFVGKIWGSMFSIDALIAFSGVSQLGLAIDGVLQPLLYIKFIVISNDKFNCQFITSITLFQTK